MSAVSPDDPMIINLRAQLILITAILPTLIATLPEDHYRGIVGALEALPEGDYPPSLAREIDELRQIFAEKARTIRDFLTEHGGLRS
ncbi:MAG: hypothetical protein JNJ63_12605 [Hyphomonadaceae bacterium]|nr:hypothetical protein [Hyphomonadaceae bacterium]